MRRNVIVVEYDYVTILTCDEKDALYDGFKFTGVAIQQADDNRMIGHWIPIKVQLIQKDPLLLYKHDKVNYDDYIKMLSQMGYNKDSVIPFIDQLTA